MSLPPAVSFGVSLASAVCGSQCCCQRNRAIKVLLSLPTPPYSSKLCQAQRVEVSHPYPSPTFPFLSCRKSLLTLPCPHLRNRSRVNSAHPSPLPGQISSIPPNAALDKPSFHSRSTLHPLSKSSPCCRLQILVLL